MNSIRTHRKEEATGINIGNEGEDNKDGDKSKEEDDEYDKYVEIYCMTMMMIRRRMIEY